MRRKNFVFCCCSLLLLVVSSSKSRQNSTSNEDKNDNSTVQHQLDVNSITNSSNEMDTLPYDFHEKSSNYTHDMQNDDTQYESRTTSTSNDREFSTFSVQNQKNDKQMPMQLGTNSTSVIYEKNFMLQKNKSLTRIEDKNDSTSHEFFKNFSKDNKSNIISYEMCHNITCIKLCCPLGNRFDEQNGTCISANINYSFPNVYGYTNDFLQNKNKTVDELFQLTVYDPCQKDERHFLLPYGHQYDYMIFTNGSIYLSFYKAFIKLSSYCLAIVEGNNFEVTMCSETSDKTADESTSLIENLRIVYVSFYIVSIIFLVLLFLVYSILPELRNVHGFMLRNYSGVLSLAYIVAIVNILVKANDVQYPVCLIIAFFNYFCFLTSFFWLNVMSFDMWWTFKGLCSLQRNVRQRGKNNKLAFYAIYAWGLPFIFAIIIIIMDSVSENLPQLLRPEFRTGNCWFAFKATFALYYYGLKSICIISSICLSIFTALKIMRYEKDTNHRLSDSESKRYNDNKKWFSLYLKLFIMLFIVMGIKWSVMTVSWLSQTISTYYSYTINVTDIVQNFCTFIIFAWKKKIKRMLLKRFSCRLFTQVRWIMRPSNSTRSITTSEDMPMQGKSSYTQRNCNLKYSSDSPKL